MSILVHKNEPIDEALKRLHGESIRENIFNAVNEKRYRIKPTEKRCAKRREMKKRKRKRRKALRRVRNKQICPT
jgi:ribosomal protein S21